jgi:hypothetical protein
MIARSLSLRATLAVLLVALAATRAWPEPPRPAGLNAWQLLAVSRSAVAALEQRFGDPKGALDPRNPVHVALRAARERMAGQLAVVEARFRARDPQVFAELEAGSRTLGELRVRWSQARAADPAAAAALRSLSIAYRRLRSVYGREGLRFRQGPPLAEAEARHFERLQQGTLILVSRLQTLRERAAQSGETARVAELDRLLREADRIVEAEPDLAAYLNTTMSNDELAGEWTAEAEDLRRLDPAGWGDADEAVSQLYVESDIGHVFQLDLGQTQDWDYLDQPTEIDLDSPGDRPAMQVFRLAGRGPDGLARFEAGGGEAPAPVLAEGEAPEEASAEGAAEEEAGAEPAPQSGAPAEAEKEKKPEPEALDPARAWELFRIALQGWLR